MARHKQDPHPRILIGRNLQAREDIFLTSKGWLVCGAYKYRGVKCRQFQVSYEVILDLIREAKLPDDISEFRTWDAAEIYEEFIAKPFKRSMSGQSLHRLAAETLIAGHVKPMKETFKKAVGKEWRRITRSMAHDDPNRPTQGWHILKHRPPIPES